MDDATTQNKEVIRPPSVWLTQVWLVFNAIPILAGGAWACFNIARGIVTRPSALHLSSEGLLGLLKLSVIIGMGLLALITFWALQKRARAGRWLALIFISLTIAKIFTAYGRTPYIHLATGEMGFLDYESIAIHLLQVTLLYRFAFGKSLKAFLSN